MATSSFSRLVGAPSSSPFVAVAASPSATAPPNVTTTTTTTTTAASSLFVLSPSVVCSSSHHRRDAAPLAFTTLGPLTTSTPSNSSYSLFSSGSGFFHSRFFATPSPAARFYASPASGHRRYSSGGGAGGILVGAEAEDDGRSASSAQLPPSSSAASDGGGAWTGLRLASGAHMIPHPEKRHKGGEDAYFLSEDGQVLGIADGVGGWALSGVDSGLYSKSLMAEAKKAVEAAKTAGVHPTRATDIMQKAYDHTKHLVGSSTAVILMAEGQTIKYSNLGDSGFMVIRGGEVVFRTREQTHAFNTPYQIGTGGDHPTDAEEGRVTLQEGDTIVLGTDGLFDNLFDEQIVELVRRGRADHRDAAEVAEMIARQAHKAGSLTSGEVPFGKAARRYGYHFEGGKMDDITVVVSFVSSPPASSPSAPISPPAPNNNNNNCSSSSDSDRSCSHTPSSSSSSSNSARKARF